MWRKELSTFYFSIFFQFSRIKMFATVKQKGEDRKETSLRMKNDCDFEAEGIIVGSLVYVCAFNNCLLHTRLSV